MLENEREMYEEFYGVFARQLKYGAVAEYGAHNQLRAQILSELFLIIGWVSFGEVIYKILFDNVKDKIKTERYKRLSRCQIEFTTKKKP